MTKPKRLAALLFAVLFLGTAIAFTVGIVLQVRQENQGGNSSLQSENGASTNQNQEDENTLQGTKLEGFTPVATVTELQKIDLQAGTGEEVKPGATVTAHYTGALAKDGTIFQSSHDFGQPIPFGLDGVIKGWTDGVPGMKVGGKRRLVIPAAQAYGEQGSPPSIGPNEPLVFDIEIVSVQQ